MLVGQHLGRGHDRPLHPRLDRAQQGPERDDRLSRPNLPLEQAVHRLGAGQVGADLGHDPGLGAGELEGEAGQEALGQVAVGLEGLAVLAGLLGAAAQGQADLEDEQLVVDQAVAGPGRLLAVAGAVDGLQGAGPVGQAVGPAQRLGHEVGHVAVAVEQGPDGPAEPARGDLLAGRVDGDDLVGELLGVVALAQHLVAGVGHAQAAGLPGELAREGGDRAHGELLGVPGLVEPGADPGAAVVDHPDLEDPEVAPGLLLGQVADGPDQGDLGALLGVGQVGELAPGQVAARVVLQQVADGAVAEAVLQRLGQRRRTPRGPWPAGRRVGRERVVSATGPV